jgi:hypothetical protein
MAEDVMSGLEDGGAQTGGDGQLNFTPLANLEIGGLTETAYGSDHHCCECECRQPRNAFHNPSSMASRRAIRTPHHAYSPTQNPGKGCAYKCWGVVGLPFHDHVEMSPVVAA